MPYSHHSHSGQFCKHGSGNLEDVVLEAIKQGFIVYGLTEHVPRYHLDDLYPEEEGMSPADLERQFLAFLDEAHRLKARYAAQITLLVGLETEHIRAGDLERLDALLRAQGGRIEYVVGSVHHVRSVPIDFDAATCARALERCGRADDGGHAQMEAFLCAYLDAQYAVVRRVQPEIVGHADVCRLYAPALEFAAYPLAWARLGRNVRYAVGYGALFEVNAAALRKGWDAAYPGEDVARLIMECGGRFALSDDSHGPQAVGLNYGRLAQYLQRLEVKELWVLEWSPSANAAGRHLHPRRVEGEWWAHAFWQER
ncbi:polymerase/histidinol phosphatase-like protein [Amylocystis lapponica]|nr:polymerase/histidinol phosphatase-like protein [Amylocystis lapponica]